MPTAAAWWIVAWWSNVVATLNAAARTYPTNPEVAVTVAQLSGRLDSTPVRRTGAVQIGPTGCNGVLIRSIQTAADPGSLLIHIVPVVDS